MALTITSAPHPTIEQAFNVNVTSSPSVTTGLQIVRVHQDGSTHRLLTTSAPILTSGTWTGIDLYAPFNQWFTYFGNGGGQTGGSAEQFLHSDHVRLLAASDPSLSVQVDRIRSLTNGGLVSRAVRLDILDSPLPVHRHDSPMTTTAGELVVQVDTPEQYAALVNLVKQDEPILVNTPFNGFELQWAWVQPKGITPIPVGLTPWFPLRDISIPFEVTSQPDVDIQAFWTVGALAARYSSVGAVAAAFTSVGNLANDIPTS